MFSKLFMCQVKLPSIVNSLQNTPQNAIKLSHATVIKDNANRSSCLAYIISYFTVQNQCYENQNMIGTGIAKISNRTGTGKKREKIAI
jgi:hypothetical protein